MIVQVIVGKPELEDVVLDDARCAVAMLRPADPVNLQSAALRNLASALRKSTKIDETRAIAEAAAIDDRIAALAGSRVQSPLAPAPPRPSPGEMAPPGRGTSPWAQAGPIGRQADHARFLHPELRLVQAARCRGLSQA